MGDVVRRRTQTPIAVLLALALLATTWVVGGAAAASLEVCEAPPPSAFTDRDTIHPGHVENVDCLAARGIAQGRSGNRFAPREPVTRDQLAAFLARAIDDLTEGPSLPSAPGGVVFPDTEGSWALDDIGRLWAAGVVTGFTDGQFRPRDPVTRDQVATMVLRAAEYASDVQPGAFESRTARFPDVGADSPHFPTVNGAAELELVIGREDGTFAPRATTRRDQMASMVARLLRAIESPGGPGQPPVDDPVTVVAPTVEGFHAPHDLGVSTPRMEWQLEAGTRRDVLQTAFQVQVASSADTLVTDDADVWDSGEVEARRASTTYDGPELTSDTTYHWRVRIRDERGDVSAWSEPTSFTTSLLDPASEWQADWIRHDAGPEIDLDDVEVTVEVTPRTDAPTGVYLRADGPNNGYVWQLASGPQLRKLSYEDGTLDELGTVDLSDDVSGGFVDETFELTVSAEGDEITTFVDGVEVDVHTDDVHDSGTVGVSLGTRHGLEQLSEFESFEVRDGDGDLVHADDFETDEGHFTGGIVADGVLTLDGVAMGFLVPNSAAEPLLRRELDVRDDLVRARLHSTALGWYELYLNGERVGDEWFAPGWTDYDQRIQLQSHDVTDLLSAGDNVIGAMLADGWYAGQLGFFGAGHYGFRPHLSAQLHLEYADGSTEVVITDESWTAAQGPITSSDLMQGERYDARLEIDGWAEPGDVDGDWSPVVVDDTDRNDLLVSQVDPPVRVVQEIDPVSVVELDDGSWLYDMGQNMVGVPRIEVAGDEGDTIQIRHAEIVDPDGQPYYENLRTAKALDTYTKRSDEPETYHARFTFHGFQYVVVDGIDGEPDLDAVTGLVIHTDAPFTSEIDTSSSLVDQLHQNITWGQRGNFLSIPTDTPARDERMGWTGDMNVFIGTAAYNMDVRRFMDKYLADVRDAQDPDGSVADVAPDIAMGRGHLNTGVAGWADAIVTLPWTLWHRYGDTEVIEDNYVAMGDWIGFMQATSDDLIRPGFGYGDHLNLDDPTDSSLLGTAFFARSSRLMAEMAEGIGQDADATRYAALADRVTDAFVGEFVGDDGTVGNGSQTGYALALAFDLVPDALEGAAADHLVAAIEAQDGHLTTGFLGTEFLLPVLTDTGNEDVAYQLLLEEAFPSWGYQINIGATTMWERWDSLRPEEGFQSAFMNSFNHFPFGSVGNWLHEDLLGIGAGAPGFEHVVIRPLISDELDHAEGAYDAVPGRIESAWRHAGDEIEMEVTIPANTTGEVHVPADAVELVTENGRALSSAVGVHGAEVVDDRVVIEIGSGSYLFRTGAARDADRVDTAVDLPDLVAAGDTFPVTVEVTNLGPGDLEQLAVDVEVPSDWEGEPQDTTSEPLGVGESRTDVIDVTVPEGTEQGQVTLPVVVSFAAGDRTATVSVPNVVEVATPVALDLDLQPSYLGEGVDEVVATIEVLNRSGADRAGTVELEAPEEWELDVDELTYEIGPGETFTDEVTIDADGATEGGVLVGQLSLDGEVVQTVEAELRYLVTSWDFEEDGEFEGWDAITNHLEDLEVSDGALRATSTGGDPWLVNDEVELELPDGAIVEVEMTTSTASSGSLFWATEDEPGLSPQREQQFPVANGEQVLRIELPALDSLLTTLRLDPLETSGEIVIDAIRVLR